MIDDFEVLKNSIDIVNEINKSKPIYILSKE